MIFELRRMRDNILQLSFRIRTPITDEFLESLPQNTRLYQVYYMGKQEGVTKETITSDLLSVAQSMDDTERTCLLKLCRQLLSDNNG